MAVGRRRLAFISLVGVSVAFGQSRSVAGAVAIDNFTSSAFSVGPNASSSQAIGSPLGNLNRTVATAANWGYPTPPTFVSNATGSAVMNYQQLGAAPSGPAVTGFSLGYSGAMNLAGANTIDLIGSGSFANYGIGSGEAIFGFALEISDGVVTKTKTMSLSSSQSLGTLSWSLGDPSFAGLNWSTLTSFTFSYSGYNNKVSGNGSGLSYTITSISIGGLTAVPSSGISCLAATGLARVRRRR